MQEHIKRLQEMPETSNVGMKWTPQEEQQLIESLRHGKDVNDIAKEHKRTQGGIKSHIKKIAVDMIENEGKSINDVCTLLHLTQKEIEISQNMRARKRCSAPTTPHSKNETTLDVLKDIRSLLLRIEDKLLKSPTAY